MPPWDLAERPKAWIDVALATERAELDAGATAEGPRLRALGDVSE